MRPGLTLILPLLILSCSKLIKHIDPVEKQAFTIKNKPIPNLCPKTIKYSISNKNPIANPLFSKFIEKIQKNYRISTVDIFVFLALFELNLRPDETTPYSRFQIIYLKGNKFYYIDDLYNKDASYVHNLQKFVKTHTYRRSVKFYTNLYDQYFPDYGPIGKNLGSYIKKHQASILNSKHAKVYFKAKEGLREGESLKKVSMSSLFRSFKNGKNFKSFTHLFQNDSMSNRASCNFDINLNKNALYPSNNSFQNSYNYFSIASSSDAILGISSNLSVDFTKTVSPIHFKVSPRPTPVPFCHVAGKNSDQYILTSFLGNDPAQHIYHLYQYGVFESTSLAELNQFIHFPRHEFSVNPPRLFYESNLGNKKHLESLLSLDFPIYHAKNIGEMWAFANISKNPGVIIDNRENGTLFCKK